MGTLYENIMALCNERGIKGGKMCTDLSISKGLLTDLKMGRRSGVSAKTADKIASYFGVTVGYLLGTETEKAPTPESERGINLSPAFFRLKQGLEPYDLSENDADFLLEVYKAHIKKNQ